MPQPRRLVGEERERGRMRLREPEAGEADELVVDPVRRLLADALARRAGDEAAAVGLERRLAPLAAHRPPQPLGLADAEAGDGDRHLEHLVLEDDDAERRAERLGEERVLDRRDERRVLAQPLPVLDVGMDGLALDRPRADERDLDGEVVEALRLCPEQALHLRSALDLEDADRVRAADLLEHRAVAERDPREVDRLRAQARDLVDAVLDRREHPEAEQVDLQEARVGAGVLVPLAHLTAGHGARLDGHELDERTRRDDHPARVLRDVPRQAGDLEAEVGKGAPARRAQLPLGVRQRRDLLPHALRVPAVGAPREPLEVGVREAERFAHVADRAARAIGREGGDERRVLAAVALGDGDDQLLADVAREVEVDVGHRDELAIEEAPQREAGLNGIDVREPGQIADDRADRAPAPAPGRKDVARDRAAAHLARALPCELEHLPVEQEEAGEAELVDQRKLLVQTAASLALVAVRAAVALGEGAVADAPELGARGLSRVGEVGVSVAEVLGQVELEARGELAGPLDGVAVEWEPLGRLVGREQDAFVVAPPFGLAALERRATANGYEDVLERRPARVMRVRVTGRDRRDADGLGKVA